MIGKISISGTIGAYEENGVLQVFPKSTTLLDVLSQFKKLPEGTRIVNVEIASPGGYVDEGNQIYDYLIAEKKNYVINTVQVGDVASIATKLFLAGDSRQADPNFEFMIHNPWTNPGAGDSKYQAEVLEALLADEQELRKFYSKELDIPEEGLAPLMDKETFLTGEQLLSLGFATQLKHSNVMAMKKAGEKEPSLTEKISALYKKVTGKEVKAEGAKALDVKLADGRTLTVDAENLEAATGATAMIDGQPAPDGDYPTAADADGMSDVVTVSGGKVTAVKEAAQAVSLPVARIDALEKNVATLVESVGVLVEASKAGVTSAIEASKTELTKEFEGKIVALKSEIGTTHTPKPGAAVYAETVDKNQTGHKSIAQVMHEKAEARKKQINGN